MGRTAALYAFPAVLVAVAWLRLETASANGHVLWLLALALLPALVAGRAARAGAAGVAALLGLWLALGVRPWHVADVARELWEGVRLFYDVRLPFDPAEHVEMHAAVELGVFVFALALALALAARRGFLAAGIVVAAVGWPVTLVTGGTDLVFGALALAAALVVVAGVRARTARALLPAAVGAGLVVAAALGAATSDAVSRDAIVAWERWDLYDRPKQPVGVEYVWTANYGGIDFPDEETPVLRIAGPERRHYWRATTLDTFTRDTWIESPYVRGVGELGGAVPHDPPLPADSLDRSRQLRQDVEVLGLRDDHLVAAATPVRYRGDLGEVLYLTDGIVRTPRGLRPGQKYTVWSYAPQPGPEALAALGGAYPKDMLRFLDVGRTRMPAWPEDRAARDAEVDAVFADRDRLDLVPYRGVLATARRVVGDAVAPYEAVVALESWFRSAGGFRYDEQPPTGVGLPPLAAFVQQTKAGYCQHYAGAMALMLRLLGVPARVAAGFTSGERKGEAWIVTDHDAHAWVEAWFPGYGWLPFDPTPGRGTLESGYTVASDSADAIQAIAAAIAGTRGGDPGAGFSERPAIRGAGGDDRGGYGIVLRLAAAVLAAALAIGGAKLALRRARYLTRDPRRLAGAARRELVDVLRDQGADVPAATTLAELCRIADDRLALDARPFAAAAGAARFGPPERAGDAARAAQREVRSLLRLSRKRLTLRERLRGFVALRSLAGA